MRIKTEITDMQTTPFKPVPRRFFIPTVPMGGGPPPECPTATMVCESISASKSKCGFAENEGHESTPPKKYLVRTTTRTRDQTVHIDADYIGSCSINETFHTNTTTTETCDPATCEISSECTGAGSVSHTHGNEQPICNDLLTCSHSWDACGHETLDPGSCQQYSFVQGGQTTDDTTATAAHQVYTYSYDSGSHPGQTVNSTLDNNVELSSEYTTDQLKTVTENALPGYSGYYNCDYPEEFTPLDGQSCLCESVYDLSFDEATLFLQKCKRKFNFSSPACVGMMVTWNYMFTPEGGTPTVYSSGGWSAGGGETATPGFEDPEITENGVLTVSGITVNCSACPAPGP